MWPSVSERHPPYATQLRPGGDPAPAPFREQGPPHRPRTRRASRMRLRHLGAPLALVLALLPLDQTAAQVRPASPSASQAATQPVLRGDADGDGRVTAADA